MAVTAGVVGDVALAAVLAGCDMTAEHRGAAALDGRHDLELSEAHVAGVGCTPGGPVGAEDVRDLEALPRHDATGSGGRQGSRAEMLQGALDGAQGGAGKG